MAILQRSYKPMSEEHKAKMAAGRKAAAERKAKEQEKPMEASATTFNIHGTQEPQPEVSPLAQALAGIQTVDAQPEAKPEVETVTVPIKMLADMQCQIEELKQLKTATGGNITFEQLAFLLQEMKKPDEETQAKLAAEKARREQECKDMLELALLEEAKTKQRYQNCNHKKENGRSAFVGQMHSDGLYHPICQHCQYEAPPIKPTTDMMSMGVG